MIDLNDLSQGHSHYSNNPVIVICCTVLFLVLRIAGYAIGELDIALSFILHILQLALAIVGLIAFRWSWIERKKKRHTPK